MIGNIARVRGSVCTTIFTESTSRVKAAQRGPESSETRQPGCTITLQSSPNSIQPKKVQNLVMSFPQGISRLQILVFMIPLFLTSAAAVASSPSAKGISASPSSVTFGNIQAGSSQTQYETLTNSGDSVVTISQATITGTAFRFTGLSLPLSLDKGHSVTFSVGFSPNAEGGASGGISVVSNASNQNLAIPLSGTGISAGQLTSGTAALNFDAVPVGTSKTLTTTLTATQSSVTVSSATSTSSEFRLDGISFPTTIAPGQSTSLTLTFTPRTSGVASGSISLVSNAANTPTVETLTGSGTAAAHSVSLSWNSAPSAVVGYNIYRSATACGPYTRVNSVLNPGTNYLDASVEGGATYYYVSTAVARSGVESKYSRQLRVVIPSP
jgi:centrosomal CEP192-like protein/ASPM-SPD-2-Hydin domain-containing protein